MSFQNKTNSLIGSLGRVARMGATAGGGEVQGIAPTTNPQPQAKPSYNEQVAEMANKLAENLIVSKNKQMQNFKTRADNLRKMSSSEWLEQAVKEEKGKNKLTADALMKNALDAEELERGTK